MTLLRSKIDKELISEYGILNGVDDSCQEIIRLSEFLDEIELFIQENFEGASLYIAYKVIVDRIIDYLYLKEGTSIDELSSICKSLNTEEIVEGHLSTQKKDILILPLNEDLPYLEGKNRIDLDIYPNGNKGKYRKISKKFLREVFDNINYDFDNTYFVLKVGDVEFVIIVGDVESVDDSKFMECIKDHFKVLIADAIGDLEFIGMKTSKETSKVLSLNFNALMTLVKLHFEAEVADNINEWTGNEGQLMVARKMGGVYMGDLYAAAKKLGVSKEYGWNLIAAPLDIVEDFLSKVELDIEKWKENEGQLRLAKELGFSNLNGLFTIASGFDLVDELGWSKLSLKYDDIIKIIAIFERDMDSYNGNEGQMKLAKELGGINLNNLYITVKSLGYLEYFDWDNFSVPYRIALCFYENVVLNPEEWRGNEGQMKFVKEFEVKSYKRIAALPKVFGIENVLKWNDIPLGVKDVDKVLEEIRTNFDDYTGNEGQLRLVEKLDLKSFRGVYSVASAFGFVKDLEWSYIVVPYRVFVKISKDLDQNRDAYMGNEGQLRFAKKHKKINLGNLYTLTSSLGHIDELGWTNLSMNYDQAIKIKVALSDDLEKWRGNEGQFSLASEFDGVNLSFLYNLASGFGYIDQLEWTKMMMPYDSVVEFLRLLSKQKDVWRENSGQIKLANELGKVHLRQLYSVASGFGLVEELGWSCIDASYSYVDGFIDIIGDDLEKWRGDAKQVEVAEKLGGINFCQLYSIASGLGMSGYLQWKRINVPFHTMKKIQDKLNTDIDQWYGNEGQIALAAEMDGMNLSQLYSVISGLKLTDVLNWTCLQLNYKDAVNCMSLLSKDHEKWCGNEGQIKLSEELGEVNLGDLYSFGVGVYGESLGWTQMVVSFDVYRKFKELIIDSENTDEWNGDEGLIKLALKLKSCSTNELYSLASGLGLVDKLGWTIMSVTYDNLLMLQEIIAYEVEKSSMPSLEIREFNNFKSFINIVSKYSSSLEESLLILKKMDQFKKAWRVLVSIFFEEINSEHNRLKNVINGEMEFGFFVSSIFNLIPASISTISSLRILDSDLVEFVDLYTDNIESVNKDLKLILAYIFSDRFSYDFDIEILRDKTNGYESVFYTKEEVTDILFEICRGVISVLQISLYDNISEIGGLIVLGSLFSNESSAERLINCTHNPNLPEHSNNALDLFLNFYVGRLNAYLVNGVNRNRFQFNEIFSGYLGVSVINVSGLDMPVLKVRYTNEGHISSKGLNRLFVYPYVQSGNLSFVPIQHTQKNQNKLTSPSQSTIYEWYQANKSLFA